MSLPRSVQNLPQSADLCYAPDERQLARERVVGGWRFGWRRVRRRRALDVRCRMRWALPKDLLVKLLGGRFRLHAELSLQNADTDLVLPKSRRPPAQLHVETHDRAVDRLLQGIEGEEPERRLQRRFSGLSGALVSKELRQRFERQLAQALALREEPLLERRLLEGEAFEQLAAIEGGGSFEGGRRAFGDLALELHHIHVDGGRVEGDGLTVDQQGRRLCIHSLPQGEE